MKAAGEYVDGCLCTRCADHHAATCDNCRKVLRAFQGEHDQADEIPVLCPEGWHVAPGHELDAHPNDLTPPAPEVEQVLLAHYDGVPVHQERVLR